MALNSVLDPPPQDVLDQQLEKKQPGAPSPGGSAAPGPSQKPAKRHEIFDDALLDLSDTRPGRRTLRFILSVTVHTLVVGILILLPLYFTEAIDLKQFTQTLLVAPPPPPPPPPASPVVTKVRVTPKRIFSTGKLMAPTAIPEKVAMLKEEPIPEDVGGAGVIGGVPGGVPGGQMGGVIGGIIGGIPSTALPPPKAAPKAPVRVGGRVKAPRPISTPEPAYPPLAKSAKIQGDVTIDAVIDTSGNVVEMRVISGHPLLIQTALDALRKWKYEPTFQIGRAHV